MTTVLILLLMFLLPGLVAYLVMNVALLIKPNISVGDFIVYRAQKASTHPGPRAYEIHASEKGDIYTYLVDKYWTVADILEGQVVAVTRTNKRRFITTDDPNLRKAGLSERILYRHRFPHFTEGHA